MRVIKPWNMLLREDVKSLFLEDFKIQLDLALSNLT